MPLKNEKERSNFPPGALIGLGVAGAIGLAHALSDKSNPNWLAYAETIGCMLALLGLYLIFIILRWAWKKHFDVILIGIGYVAGLVGAAMVMALFDFIDGRNVNLLRNFEFALCFFFMLWVLREVIASGVEKGIKAAK